jgi:hypothetical protein
MSQLKLTRIEKAIGEIKKRLFNLGDIRPGSLSKQMRRSKEKYGAYWHLSYTHKGKGHTEYIREEFVQQLKQEVKNYKRYRILFDRLVTLSIKKSKLKMTLGSDGALKQQRTRYS